ncbi:replication-relaxation family protein [Enterococcus mundtii]|uniref:replication-relaxation family protein n=1 Tax=Enterococcus mundtii TaxID=53346 RepID=UPI001F157790|nr:replication-relaxation family protein [Enterococcus mundtii]
MTAKQIVRMMNQEFPYSLASLYRRLATLKKLDMIDYITIQEDQNIRYFFLTKKGHNSIGGIYSFPKVPEYNLNHHIEVTNYLIESMDLAKKKPTFILAQSERRQMYEKKDMSKAKKGTLFHVSDYVLRFENQMAEVSNWHFEIELTLKSQNRYTKAIFPKYLRLLTQKRNAQLIYVTPSNIIYNSLDMFKEYFLLKKQDEELKSIDASAFDRLRIVSSKEFNGVLKKMLEENDFINER